VTAAEGLGFGNSDIESGSLNSQCSPRYRTVGTVGTSKSMSQRYVR